MMHNSYKKKKNYDAELNDGVLQKVQNPLILGKTHDTNTWTVAFIGKNNYVLIIN